MEAAQRDREDGTMTEKQALSEPKKRRPPRFVLERRAIKSWKKLRDHFGEDVRRRGAKVAARSLCNHRLYALLGV
jgi:hypothetical protein